jgi:hypothetical protein
VRGGAQQFDQNGLGMVFPLADNANAGLVQGGRLVDKYRQAVDARQTPAAKGHIGYVNFEHLPFFNSHGTGLLVAIARATLSR